MVVASFHLNYASPTLWLIETEWLTTLADKAWTVPVGDGTVRLPCLMGGDGNSYPGPGVAGDPPVPDLWTIADERHRLHRSYPGLDGGRLMDTRPDEALRLAGLEDVARYRTAQEGEGSTAVSRTVDACATHGPDARVDRIYATTPLPDAVTGVESSKSR